MIVPAAPHSTDHAPDPQTIALVVLAQEIDALLGQSPPTNIYSSPFEPISDPFQPAHFSLPS